MQKILLIILVFIIFWYTLNKYFKSKKIIEGNKCSKKKTWCTVKDKCVSIWGEICDIEA